MNYRYDITFIAAPGMLSDFKTIYPSDYGKERLTDAEILAIAKHRQKSGNWTRIISIEEIVSTTRKVKVGRPKVKEMRWVEKHYDSIRRKMRSC